MKDFQMPQEPPKEPTDSILPLSERLKSKIWKTRQIALDELIKLYSSATDPKDEVFAQFLEDFQRLAADSNLVAQEKALEAFKILIEKSDLAVFCGFKTKEILKVAIEKAYASGKNVLKEHVLSIVCFFYVKLDRRIVIETLLEGLPHKNHKVYIFSYVITSIIFELRS